MKGREESGETDLLHVQGKRREEEEGEEGGREGER